MFFWNVQGKFCTVLPRLPWFGNFDALMGLLLWKIKVGVIRDFLLLVIFTTQFFLYIGPLTHGLKPFRILYSICRDIRQWNSWLNDFLKYLRTTESIFANQVEIFYVKNPEFENLVLRSREAQKYGKSVSLVINVDKV
jgi:hypothetical protein